MGRIFSKNGLVELLKSLILLGAIGLISYKVVRSHLALFPELVLMDVRKIFHWTTVIS